MIHQDEVTGQVHPQGPQRSENPALSLLKTHAQVYVQEEGLLGD